MRVQRQLARGTGTGINPKVFFQTEFFAEYNSYKQSSELALEQLGPIPLVVWGYLRYHIYECRWTNPANKPKPKQISEVLKAGFTMVNYMDNRTLARALTRLVCVAAATFHLEVEPKKETLTMIRSWLDRYEELLEEPKEEYERWCSEMFYSQARVRTQAWEIALNSETGAKNDYGFIADCVYSTNLEWAVEPVAELADFKEWARENSSKRISPSVHLLTTKRHKESTT